MKTYLALLATAGLLATSTAIAQPVYSNIVGMIKHDLSDTQFKMVALQFDDSESGIPLENAFGSLNDLTTIFVYDPNATQNPYSTYVYYDGFGWYEGVSEVQDGEVVLTKGMSVWIKDGGGGSSPVHSGTVPEEDSIDVNIVSGLNMIANPYPTELKLVDIDISNLSDGDVIWVYDSVYTKYTYYSGFGWYEGVSEIDPETKIPAGQGFWLHAQTAGTMTFNKPY